MFISPEEKDKPIEQITVAYEEIIAILRIENQHYSTEIHFLKNENARLQEELKMLRQQHFGKQRDVASDSLESPEPLENQSIPNDDLKKELNEATAAEQSNQTISVGAHTRKTKNKKCGHLADLSSLPRHAIHHDLSEDDKICACCNKSLHFIGTEKSEQLEILPQYFYVAEHIRYKYGCRSCETLIMGPKEPAPIPKALAGSSLLTEVIINKYGHHLPLYRQSKMMKNLGMIIPDNTLSHWVSAVGVGLEPVMNEFWKALLANRYLQVDETPVKLLDATSKGYLWVYFAPHLAPGRGLVCIELKATRQGAVAEERLATFEGLLQTDGYSGYASLRKRKNITGFSCMTHARRKFSDVIKISNDHNGIAAEVIKKLQPLYELEAMMRHHKIPLRSRKRFRQQYAKPLLIGIHQWLVKIAPNILPKSKLANAVHYMLNQWPYLINYVNHGMAEIDTNGVERQIRPMAIGRKNWLFMKNENTGKVHSTFYSLILSATLNNLNPRLYLHYLITKMHDIRRGILDPATLLPHVIKAEVLKTFYDQLIADAKVILNNSGQL